MGVSSDNAIPLTPASPRVVHRYELHELLGRGGMACVYRATDLADGRQVALKQLEHGASADDNSHAVALFEREFHTLAQLHHPRVISVYDFGIEPGGGAYYTMELLDGGDLYECAPLPWRETCALFFDVCSSLALLHSRRLLHRDISPRNIRRTRDGRAKLIDFGAMAAMGPADRTIVGTPAFTSPEILHRLTLDARADLFSLGVTLYFTLTRTLPYPARNFSDLVELWSHKPLAPSALGLDIPSALDDLVLSLISTEPSLRPRSAFEVMQRLAAIAGLESTESDAVSRAYLVAPSLVGRTVQLTQLRAQLVHALSGRTSGLLISGGAGFGRTRMLDACVLEAKTLGALVLRAHVTGSERLAVASTLAHQLLDALPLRGLDQAYPELFELKSADTELITPAPRPQLVAFSQLSDTRPVQDALCKLCLAVAKLQPLVIAVDDVQRIDHASAAVLAHLLDSANSAPLFVALGGDLSEDAASPALNALARRCELQTLTAITEQDTKLLLGSIFGEVANLDALVSEFHKVARGNPGQCMAIAQHLLDTGVIQYSSGTWVLPSALHAADLPSTAQDTITCQIAGLSSAAQLLAQCQALAFYDSLSRSDYHALCPTVDKITVERALSELIAAQALVGDGKHFVLANRVWVQALHTPLDAATLRQRHDALAEMYRPHSDIALTYHLFASGRDADGLAALQQRHLEYAQGVDYKKIVEQNISKLTPTYASAIAAAERLGRSAREVNELRRWFVAVCSSSEANYYWHAAPAWLEKLAHDSGLAFWRDDADNPDASARLFGALQRAQERYVATPEAARVYSVEEAIRLLAEYVVFSIAVGARTLNSELLSSLPDVIAPFAPLSPLLEAIWLNARATYDCNIVGDDDAARARWNTVLEKLEAHKGALPHLEAICSAVSLGVGMMEAQMGLESAVTWAARVEQDPLQRLAALQLRKIVRLTQGDWNGADKLRREAELYALHSPAQQMFQWLLTVELDAYAYARDLAGLTQVAEQLKAWAARYSGWLPFVHIAEACFHVVRGDYAAAKLGFEHCLELAAPSTNGAGLGHSRRVQVWLGAHAGLADVLLELGDAVSAERYARSGLEYCEQRGLHSRSFELSRMLALTEAKQGRFESASERLAQLVDAMKTLGTSGLRLGMAYEARALVAAWQSAASDFEHYARVTAQEYRYAAGCPLGVRYERLLNEATRCGLRRAPELSDFAPADLQASRSQEVRNVYSMVLRTLTGATRSEERAQRSLQLICDLSGCASGHLYLVRPNGLQLAASVGSDPPHARASLQAAVQAELAQCARADAEDLETRLVTSVDHDAPSQRRTVTIEEVDYELLPLSCLQDASIVQVGMIALCVGGEAAERAAIVEQPLLLATIAAQLARAQVSLTPTRKR